MPIGSASSLALISIPVMSFHIPVIKPVYLNMPRSDKFIITDKNTKVFAAFYYPCLQNILPVRHLYSLLLWRTALKL